MKPLAQPSLGASLLPKACILVAGMHRSGTSAAARVINLLGADIARDLTPAIPGNNDRGFWEPRAVVAIHDRLLADLDSAWDDPFSLPARWMETDAARQAKRELAEEVRKDFSGGRICTVKDPRLGRLLPLWLELLDELEIEPVVVVPVRNPLEVAASLQRRDRLPLAKSLLIYLRYTLDAELASRGRRRIFVRYDHLLVDWRSFARKLEKAVGTGLLTPVPDGAAAIDRFLTLDLYHNRATHETLSSTPDVPATVVELFDRMSETAESGDETALREACDRIRAVLSDTSEMFRRALSHGSNGSEEPAPFPAIRRSLAEFVSPPSFWFPEYFCNSAWIEHAPFASWLVDVHRPATLVELGTHWGFSFFAFCQAVHALGLATRCFAVDTWRGDEHAGWYGEEVFASVREHNERRYSAFAGLMRATFDEAAREFPDGSIDLLHIDGRHFYEDVRHDFELWLPKLSRQGLVVFHDTAVRERGFGVHRLWGELRQTYPHFEFAHGHGLGVLGVGQEIGVRLSALFEAGRDEALAQQIRLAYARLGAGLSEVSNRIAQTTMLSLKDDEIAAHAAEIERVQQELAAERGEVANLTARAAELERVQQELAGERSEVARLTAASAALRAESAAQASAYAAQASTYTAQLKAQAAELDAIKASTSWRITRPLRVIVDAARHPFRRAVRERR